jgi:transcriptional regulator with XRE-family HTH domain
MNEFRPERLSRIRAERGWSLREAAKETGNTKETISELENGRRKPHPATLRKLANGFGVPISYFLDAIAPKAQSRPSSETPEDLIGEERPALSIKEASAAPARFSEFPGLRAARERRGILRYELATRTGMSPDDIAGLESGARDPDSDTLARLTSALGATPGELGFAPEQYEPFLRELERQKEQDRRKLEELDASDTRAMLLRERMRSPEERKLADAVNEIEKEEERPASEAG